MGIGLSAQGVNMNRLPGESLVTRTYILLSWFSLMRVMVAANHWSGLQAISPKQNQWVRIPKGGPGSHWARRLWVSIPDSSWQVMVLL